MIKILKNLHIILIDLNVSGYQVDINLLGRDLVEQENTRSLFRIFYSEVEGTKNLFLSVFFINFDFMF